MAVANRNRSECVRLAVKFEQAESEITGVKFLWIIMPDGSERAKIIIRRKGFVSKKQMIDRLFKNKFKHLGDFKIKIYKNIISVENHISPADIGTNLHKIVFALRKRSLRLLSGKDGAFLRKKWKEAGIEAQYVAALRRIIERQFEKALSRHTFD